MPTLFSDFSQIDHGLPDRRRRAIPADCGTLVSKSKGKFPTFPNDVGGVVVPRGISGGHGRGEGSHGGHIIGHTKSGRPIYTRESGDHRRMVHGSPFDQIDHIEAATAHALAGDHTAAARHLVKAHKMATMSPEEHLEKIKHHVDEANNPKNFHRAGTSNGHLEAAMNHAFAYGVKTGDTGPYRDGAGMGGKFTDQEVRDLHAFHKEHGGPIGFAMRDPNWG